MVGDVSVYMNDPDNLHVAEIEIMIAESKRYCFLNFVFKDLFALLYSL